MENFLQNPLFIQALAGLGASLDPTGPAGALGAIAQQGVQSKNYQTAYNHMLKQLLASGAKGTIDSTGMKLNVPNSAFSSMLGGGQGDALTLLSPEVASSFKPDASVAPTATTPTATGGRPTLANPFVGEDQYGMTNLSASDLAGLSPDMIASAFGLAQNTIGLKDKSYNDLVDAIYKKALTSESEARTGNIPIQQALELMKLEKENALDNPFPIAGPGGGIVTTRQWQALPEKDRSYLIAKHGAALIGDDNFMSQREWESTAPTERGRFLKEIMNNPKMKSLEKELRKAGATTINLEAKLAEKKALGNLEGQLYFSDPKWTEDLSKHINTQTDLGAFDTYLDNPKEMTRAKAVETVKFVENKVTGGGGLIEDVKKSSDGRTMIWKVRWPSGDVKEVRAIIK